MESTGTHSLSLGTRMERLLFGSNSIEGTLRVLVYIVVFAAIGATLNILLA